MPFREKLRKVLSRDSEGKEKPKTSTTTDNDPLKPRARGIGAENEQKLKSYDIGTAFGALRRKSMAKSDVSPGGSRRSSGVPPEGRKSIVRPAAGASALGGAGDGQKEDENVDPLQAPPGDGPKPTYEESPKTESQKEKKLNGLSKQSTPIDGEELAARLSATKLATAENGAASAPAGNPEITVTAS